MWDLYFNHQTKLKHCLQIYLPKTAIAPHKNTSPTDENSVCSMDFTVLTSCRFSLMTSSYGTSSSSLIRGIFCFCEKEDIENDTQSSSCRNLMIS